MKKHVCWGILLLALFLLPFGQSVAQKVITLKGKVQFVSDDFAISVYRYSGTIKEVLAQTKVNPTTHEYRIDVPADNVGRAIVDCGGWQSVNIWVEDEDLGIDFRGVDTAKVKIKNPPYVYIKGGRNNDLMNLLNFASFRNYQALIAYSQAAYRSKFASDEDKKKLTTNLYAFNSDDYRAYCRFLAEHYADRTSVLAALDGLNYEKDRELVNSTLDKLSAQSESSKQLSEAYRKDREEALARKARMQPGAPAPVFTFFTNKNKQESLDKYRGRILVLDFWASWCGPCRAEIPRMKAFYEEFKDKGVEFLSISIDAKKEAWQKAMAEEKMAWKQGWVNDGGKNVMDLYQFSGIPFILVLDKNGNIYKKNVRGEDIKKAIQDAVDGKAPTQPQTISMGAMGM